MPSVETLSGASDFPEACGEVDGTGELMTGSVEICNKSLGVIGVVGTECAAITELVECKPLAVDGNENDGSE